MSNENNVHYSKKVDTTREAETVDEMPQVRCPCGQNFRAYATVFVLVTINLLNYMDRFTIAGVLIKIQKYFNKENDNSITGLLQTSFICSYMIVAPIFGYLGDRLKRKYLMAGGVLVWSAVVFSSTLLSKDHFWWFLVLRGVVGIGEASYSTIAPTVIADLFTGDKRTRMLSIFYFAIPVGSGLGYVVGSEVAKVLGSWQAGLRVTPVLGVVCVILLLFVVHEPPRGAIERGVNPNIISASNVHHGSSYCQDLMYLFKVKSFIWLDIGFTCVTFVTGALAFWAPKFMYFASKVQGVNSSENAVSFKFGIITCVAGIVGVWLGAESARRWRATRKNADPLVCAIGLISCTPFLYVSLLLASSHINIAYACVFLGEVLLCMNWAPVGDMLLYIIIPPRRSSAEAVQILMSHLFGDAGSPWLIGFIADTIRGDKTSPEARVKAFEYSFFITTFICVLGGLCFIICSFYIERDRDEADAFNQTDDTSSLLNSVPGGHHDDEDDDDDMIIANNESGSESPLTVPVTVPADEIEVHHDQNAPVA